jgi:serine/threonine protein phosphatase PrpC
MIGYYNLSLQGNSHKASGKVCQDASRTITMKNGWVLAIIADGLGSAKCSHIGAALAVDTVIEQMNKLCPKKWEIKKITSVLHKAFSVACDVISKRAAKDKIPLSEYDTTLTVAVYNGSQVVYAHVGDGGIITLSKYGDFLKLTKQQKGDQFNTVIPLRMETKWAFGESDNNICAFSMLTDGIYDVVCPWILAEHKQPIYVNYIRPFIDRNLLKANCMRDMENIQREVETFLNSEYNANITDDKTIATVINLSVLPTVKQGDYYAEPEWEHLQSEHKKKLYS